MNETLKPKLSDVLGALVTSVAYGRNVADVGALRVARNYYQNELLRGIPVPRLRINRVSISLPLILSDVILGNPALPNKPEEIVKKISEAFMKEIENEKERLEALKDLLKNSSQITEDQQKSIAIYKEFLDFWNETWNIKDTHKIGISVFEDQLRENILNSVSKLKLIEGNTEPSDILIIDTTVEAAEDSLVFVMSKAYSLLQERKRRIEEERREKERKEEERKESEKRTKNEKRMKFITEKRDNGEIDEEIATELLNVLVDSTFNEEDWNNKVLEAQNDGKLDYEIAAELCPDIFNEKLCCSMNEEKEIEEKAQEIEEYDENWAKKELTEFIEGEYKKRLISEVRHAAENAAISRPTTPPDLYVVVNTESIKNAGGGPDVVTRLNLVLHEEGLEWLSEKRDGKDTTILIPE
jgi:hypothetical protein